MKKLSSALFVSALLLSACGSSKTSDSSTAQQLDTTTVTQTPATLSSVSDNGGCSGYTQSSEVAPFTTEWGTCKFEGTEVQAYVFPNQTAVDEFFKAVSGFGIIAEQTAVAPQTDGQVFVWAPKDATKLVALQAAFAG